MEEAIDGGPAVKPLWRRIIDFPLVAMVIAVGLLAGTVWLAGLVIRQFPHWGIPDASRQMIAGLAVVAITVAVYKLAICKLGEQPRDDLRREHAVRDLALGLGGGAILFSLVTLIAAMVGVYDIVGWGSTRSILYALVMIGIIPGVLEEVLFRGILFRHIEDFGGSWFALALTSALFGVAHIFNPNATVFSSFAIAIEAGVLLGGAYMLTRNLWMPIGLHAAWNFTQGWIFDVPVSGTDQNGMVQAQLSGPELLSGGAFGLEASVIAMVLATSAGVVLVVLAIKRGELMQPWWTRRRIARETGSTHTPVSMDSRQLFGIIGTVLVACGAIGAFAALMMSTSVSTPIGEVSNLSLLSQQQNYLILSGFAAVVGAILLLFSRGGRRSAD